MRVTLVLVHADGGTQPMEESFKSDLPLDALKTAILKAMARSNARHVRVLRDSNVAPTGGKSPVTGIIVTCTFGWEVYDDAEVRFKELIVTLSPEESKTDQKVSHADRKWWFSRG